MSDLTSQCDAPRVTRDETRNKRANDARRARAYRRRKQLGLMARTVRITPKVVTKLVELGYLSFESRGDAKAEGIAIEAYLGDYI